MKRSSILLLWLFCLLLAFRANGQAYCWAYEIPSLQETGGPQSIVADNLGNIYCYAWGFISPCDTCTTDSITIRGITLSPTGNPFLVKYNAASSAIDWVITDVGGPFLNTFLTTDRAGNCYVYYDSGLVTVNTSFGLAKIDPSGRVLWRETAQTYDTRTSTGIINSESISVDNLGHVYISGYFSSMGLICGSDTLSNISLDSNCYVMKFDTSGHLIWSRLVSSPVYVNTVKVANDHEGNLLMSGVLDSSPITILDSSISLPFSGAGIFVAKCDSFGHVDWITANKHSNPHSSIEGGSQRRYYQLTSDGYGNAYVAGLYFETDTLGSIPITYNRSNQIFVAKYRAGDGGVDWAKTGSGEYSDNAVFCMATNASGESYLTFESDADSLYFAGRDLHWSDSLPSYGGIAMVKIDDSGNVLCITTIGGTSGDDDCGVAIDDAGFGYIDGDFSRYCKFGDTVMFADSAVETYFYARYNCSCTSAIAMDTLYSHTDTVVCALSDTAACTLNAPSGLSYLWFDSAAVRSYLVYSSGVYWVSVIGTTTVNIDTFYVTFTSTSPPCNTITGIAGTPTASGNVQIFPNPVDNELTIITAQPTYTSLTITNSIGQQLIQQQITSTQTIVNIQSLPPGMYYITLKGENGNMVKNFVKV